MFTPTQRSPPFSTRWHLAQTHAFLIDCSNSEPWGPQRRNPEVGGLTGHEAKAMINQRCGELPLCHRSFPGTTTYNILLMDKIRLTTKDDDYPIVYRVSNHPRWCRISSINSSTFCTMKPCAKLGLGWFLKQDLSQMFTTSSPIMVQPFGLSKKKEENLQVPFGKIHELPSR